MELERYLDEIPALLEEVIATQGTRPVTTERLGGSSASPGSRVLADLERMGLPEYLTDLEAWCDFIAHERYEAELIPLPVLSGPNDWCSYLRTCIPFSAGRGYEDALEEDVRNVHARLERLTQARVEWNLRCKACSRRATIKGGVTVCEAGHLSLGPKTAQDKLLTDMTIKEAADLLNIPMGTIRQWRKRGKLPEGETIKPWALLRLRDPHLARELAQMNP